MRIHGRTLILSGALALVMAVPSFAGQLRKKDGTLLQGDVTGENAECVTMRLAAGGIEVVAKSDVKSVDREARVDIALELEKLKKDVASRLAALAATAARQGDPSSETAFKKAAGEVNEWRLSSPGGGAKEAARHDPLEELTTEPAPPPPEKPILYSMLVRRISELRQAAISEDQRARRLKKLLGEVDGHSVRMTGVIERCVDPINADFCIRVPLLEGRVVLIGLDSKASPEIPFARLIGRTVTLEGKLAVFEDMDEWPGLGRGTIKLIEKKRP